MKAAVLHGQEDVRIEETHAPILGAGEVRIQLELRLPAALIMVYRRGYPARMITPPAVFGHEFAGSVTGMAEDVAGWEIGDRVVAADSAPCGECLYCKDRQPNLCGGLLFLNGASAESIVVPARIVEKNLLPLSTDIAFADAALTEPLACVVQRPTIANSKPATNPHHWLWPNWTYVCRALSHIGCEVHLAGRGNAATAAQLGAITYEVKGEDVVAAANTNGPFDVVIEAVGKPACWEAAVALVRKGGTVNFFGGCPKGSSSHWTPSSSITTISRSLPVSTIRPPPFARHLNILRLDAFKPRIL